MQIVSSVILSQTVEVDGRIRVIEQFTDDAGNSYTQTYLANPGDNLNARLTADATAFQDAMTAIENAVPQEITPLQARRALNAAGLRSQVEAAVAAGSQDTKDAWQFATMISRDDSLIAALGTQLGLTSDQIDNLFRSAVTFE